MARKLTGGLLRKATTALLEFGGNKAAAAVELLSQVPDLSKSRLNRVMLEAARSISAAEKLSSLKSGKVLKQDDIPIAARVAGHDQTSLKYQYRVDIEDFKSRGRKKNRVIYVNSVRSLSADEVYSKAARAAPNQPQYVKGEGWVQIGLSDAAVFTISSVVRSR